MVLNLKPNEKEQFLLDCLSTLNNQVTIDCITASAMERLQEFFTVSKVLIHNNDYSFLHLRIVDTLEQFKTEPTYIFYRRMSSPIFRSWLHQLGRALASDLNQKVVDLTSLWNNMCMDIQIDGNFIQILTVQDGYCITWDPAILFKCKDLKTVLFVKENYKLEIRNPENN